MNSGRIRRNPRGIAKIHEKIAELNGLTFPHTLYHYTSSTVLDILLKSKQFWATNIFYLNDAQEYYKGISSLSKLFADNSEYLEVLEDIKQDNGCSYEGIFSVSFSQQEDNLHQWITYAKQGGVCIGLDFYLLKNYKLVLEGMKNTYATSIDCCKVLAKARYLEDKPNEWMKAINEAINEETKSSDDGSGGRIEEAIVDDGKQRIKDYLRLVASYCKDSAFKIEDEYRSVFFPLFSLGFDMPKLFYYVTPAGIIRPYVKVGFLETDSSKNLSNLPIKSITIGPAGNQQSVFDSVVHRVRFGQPNVMDYWKKKEGIGFKNNFMDYFFGSLQDYAEQNASRVGEKEIKKVYQELFEFWRSVHKKYSDTDKSKLSNKDYFPGEDECVQLIRDKNADWFAKDDSGVDRSAEIIKHIKKNHFFTKEGIWIKKSQIPYVY